MASLFTHSLMFLPFLLPQISGQNTSQHISPATGLPPCDALLNAGFGDKLILPKDKAYNENRATYWTLNARLHPWCVLQPSNTEDVSQAIQVLIGAGEGAGDWHIAVRSGGHSSDGSNNIDNGVTIDLSMMNHTTYDKNTKLAHIQPGGRWKNVLAELQKFDVIAAGGRDGDVGVGGFLLGGGNTFYAGRTGFGCDSVINFEIVLANGSIINANQSANADLWKALKGGSNNFGIVTRFDTTTLPSRNLSYTERTIARNHSAAFINAITDYNAASNDYPDDAVIAFYGHQPSAPGTFMTVIEVNTHGITNSSIFDKFNQIPYLTSKHTLENTAQAALDSQLPGNGWSAGTTVTFRNNPEILQYVVQQHDAFVASLSQRVGSENFTTECFFQPVPSSFGRIGAERGGNMLGLPTGEDVFIWTGGVALATSADDLADAHAELMAMTARITAFAKRVGGHVDLVYLNYADASQDPLGSYPAENVQLIREVAAKYDPTGVFQRRIPRGFKISRVM